ncbi:MAG: DUF4389 domain-containing protein [Alphaproteobacteria bacterium]
MSQITEEELKRNVSDKDTWLRLLYMIIFGVAFYFGSILLFVIAWVQFLAKLFSGKVIDGLLNFGINLAIYLGQIAQYLSYATNDKPFPFGPFPQQVVVPTIEADKPL